MKSLQEGSRTGKLWTMFMNFVSVVRQYILAEWCGSWKLHLQATQEMLPYLAAAGQNNYAKCCRLYLQDCQELCSCFDEPLEKGLFTVRRNDKLFWSGTWSDMTIEQSLMRAGKTQGGLINITHKEAAKTKWLLSAHVVAQFTDALRCLTNTFTGTWSEQHRDVHPGNIKKDLKDLKTFTNFLESHNPFVSKDGNQLINIATGIIADERVNVDEAVAIGRRIQDTLDDKKYGEISLKRSHQATTFAAMRKPLKVESDNIRMSSSELYQRLLASACVNGPPQQSVFAHELATVAPALFHDDGSMCKSQKSQLAKHLIQMNPDVCTKDYNKSVPKVIDGCALIHQIPWPKVGTMGNVCELYISVVKRGRDEQVLTWVIFDSYEIKTTKDSEQKRRKLHHAQAPDILVSVQTPVPRNKTAFLANMKNKQNFIKLLGTLLEEAGIPVKHAGEEGDADVVIVHKVLQLAQEYKEVFVQAEDTDILILLLYHLQEKTTVFMVTRQRTIAIHSLHQSLGKELCKSLLFVHAMSGCDTTSAFFGMGKLKTMNILTSSAEVRQQMKLFGDISADKETIGNVGEKFVVSLYGGGWDKNMTLNMIRYLNVISPKYVPVERMPPTGRACHFHSLRVHHQVSTWKHLSTVLKKEEYGFNIENGSVVPVITDIEPAPPDLLQDIRCSCKSTKRQCVSCSCARKGMPCSIHCKCSAQCENRPKLFECFQDTVDNV